MFHKIKFLALVLKFEKPIEDICLFILWQLGAT